MRISHDERRERRGELVVALRDDPTLSLTAASQRFGLSPMTVKQYARHFGISIAGRGNVYSAKSENPQRDQAWIERYKAGETLEQIASTANPRVSRERVRQVIAAYEANTGQLIPRHAAGGKGQRRAPRVTWECEICGEQRELRAAAAALLRSKRCIHCHNVDIDKINAEIAMRREVGNWAKVQRAFGYAPTSAAMQRHVYRYLLHMGQTDVIAELWPRGVPPWLAKVYAASR